MSKVFIIVLNFNGGSDILECLKALRNEKAKIVIVDNGSEDGSVEEIEKQYKNVKIIRNKKNLGFAAGNNVGIKYALKNGALAVLLLNQDTVAPKGFLKSLLANPADIVSPVLKFKRRGEWYYDFGGKVNWWLGRTTHIEYSHLRGVHSFTSPVKNVDYVSGCVMLVRKSVFNKIGLLDERFFLYFEDVDFCLRARRTGFKIAVEPKAIVFHKLSEKKKKPLKQHFNLIKSNFIFINRHVPFFKRPLAYAYIWFLLIKILINNIL